MRDVSKNIVQIAFELEVKFELSSTLTNKKKKKDYIQVRWKYDQIVVINRGK